MIALIAASLISQTYAKDFAFMKSQELWVMAQAPQGMNYQWVVGPEVLSRVDMWLGPDPTKHWRAVDELTAMGDDAIRPMFWLERSNNKTVAWLGEVVLERLRRCKVCKGTGICPGFDGEPVSSGSCKNCNSLEYFHHGENFRSECSHCRGRGFDMVMPGDYTH